MKKTLIAVAVAAVSTLSTNAMATSCPGGLSADRTYECIVYGGGSKYLNWAREFYKDTQPETVKKIEAAYEKEWGKQAIAN